MTMCKMDKDKNGKVSFEDFQATVSIADICERDAFEVKEEPLLAPFSNFAFNVSISVRILGPRK